MNIDSIKFFWLPFESKELLSYIKKEAEDRNVIVSSILKGTHYERYLLDKHPSEIPSYIIKEIEIFKHRGYRNFLAEFYKDKYKILLKMKKKGKIFLFFDSFNDLFTDRKFFEVYNLGEIYEQNRSKWQEIKPSACVEETKDSENKLRESILDGNFEKAVESFVKIKFYLAQVSYKSAEIFSDLFPTLLESLRVEENLRIFIELYPSAYSLATFLPKTIRDVKYVHARPLNLIMEEFRREFGDFFYYEPSLYVSLLDREFFKIFQKKGQRFLKFRSRYLKKVKEIAARCIIQASLLSEVFKTKEKERMKKDYVKKFFGKYTEIYPEIRITENVINKFCMKVAKYPYISYVLLSNTIVSSLSYEDCKRLLEKLSKKERIDLACLF